MQGFTTGSLNGNVFVRFRIEGINQKFTIHHKALFKGAVDDGTEVEIPEAPKAYVFHSKSAGYLLMLLSGSPVLEDLCAYPAWPNHFHVTFDRGDFELYFRFNGMVSETGISEQVERISRTAEIFHTAMTELETKEKPPFFRYHPDPLKTGAVEARNTTCVCCGKVRGFIYVASVYSRGEYEERICPWCIADGSAAEKLQASFVSDLSAPVSPEVAKEIRERTPGFTSWQQEEWQVHCGDACEFHGDVSKGEMKELKSAAVEYLRWELQMDESEWPQFVKHYEPGGDPAVYKFVCGNCGVDVYSWDCS